MVSASRPDLLGQLGVRRAPSVLGDKLKDVLGEAVVHSTVKTPASSDIQDALRAVLVPATTVSVASHGFRPLAFSTEVAAPRSESTSKVDVLRGRLCATLEDDSTVLVAALTGIVAAAEQVVAEASDGPSEAADVAAVALRALGSVGRLLSLHYRRVVVLARDVAACESAGHYDATAPVPRIKRDPAQGEARVDKLMAMSDLTERVKLLAQQNKASTLSHSSAPKRAAPAADTSQSFRHVPRHDRGRPSRGGYGRKPHRPDSKRPPPSK